MSILFLNDVDVRQVWGASIVAPGLIGWLDAVAYETEVVSMPGGLGGFRSQVKVALPRVIIAHLGFRAATLAERGGLLHDFLAAHQGRVRVRTGDRPGVEAEGEVTESPTDTFDPEIQWNSPMVRTILTIECEDPRKRDVAEQEVAVSTSFAAVPTGSMPHHGVLDLEGVTNPSIIVEDGAGNVRATLALQITTEPGQILRLNADHQTAHVIQEGEEDANVGPTAIVSGGFWEFRRDMIVGGNPPRIRTTSGSGTLKYRRRYLS